MTTKPYDRLALGTDSSGRPLVINGRTAAMLKDAERRLGKRLTIVQGSFTTSNASSGNTHAGGGVVDIRTWDLGSRDLGIPQVLKALRTVGFAAWYRTPAQGFDPHIHAVAIGDQQMSPEAARQVADYLAGRNGLANHGPDDGPRVKVRTWDLVRRRVRVRLAQRDLDDWLATHTATGEPKP